MRVDGGLSNSDILMQIQANVLKRPLHRPKMRETTAYGAAVAAAIAVGLYQVKNGEEKWNGTDDDVFQAKISEEGIHIYFSTI